MGLPAKVKRCLLDLRRRHAEFFAELLGTFIVVAFGVGVVAQVTLNPPHTKGDFLSISCAWGLGVTLSIYVSGGVSGAHHNPAVTLGLAVHRGFPWRKVIPFVTAQILGAFLGAGAIYINQLDALNEFDRTHDCERIIYGENATAGVFATYPAEYLTTAGALFNEVLAGMIFFIGVLALTDTTNVSPGADLTPILLGATVAMIIQTFGALTGPSLNPARDFGPRAVTALAGWGSGVFTVRDYYFWVPFIGPCIGMVVGGFVYDGLVGRSTESEPRTFREESVVDRHESKRLLSRGDAESSIAAGHVAPTSFGVLPLRVSSMGGRVQSSDMLAGH